jgi:hypothetical protein
VAHSAVALDRAFSGDRPLAERAKRSWDLPAKIELAKRIAREEIDRSIADAGAEGAHNNAADAMRHARWSYRTAESAGPVFTELVGIGHELDNLGQSFRAHGTQRPYQRSIVPTPGQTLDEIQMDLLNNAAGRLAAAQGRPIDVSRLQTSPKPSAGSRLYRYPPARLEGLPPR